MKISTKILITGKSGTGKTTYLKHFLKFGGYNNVFIFDHQGELAEDWKIKACVDTEGIKQQTEQGFCLFDPAVLFPGETEEAFEFFADYVFQWSQNNPGKKLLSCDEFQMFSNTDCFSWELSRAIENGRRYGLDCCFVAQQLNLIHNRARNQLTEIVAFQNTDWRVLRCLEENGFDPEEISKLETFHFVLRNLQTDKTQRGRILPEGMAQNQTQNPEIRQPELPQDDETTEIDAGIE